MENSPVKLVPETRWKVLFTDPGTWRVGVYRPEFNDPEKIELLERHSCPELFVCAGGRMGLLTFDGSMERVLRLEPDEAVLLSEYHNGFRIDEGGYFLVVERTSFRTEYIDRNTKIFVRSVET